MPITEQEAIGRARERIGSVLKGKYRLDRVLGVGGMAAVYGATHLRNTNRVAVKLLHREVATEPDLRERFLREGYAANSVEHPGTVRIIDDDTAEDGAVFLVMELLEGETLDARWERKGGKLKPEEVVRLMHDLLDVLAAAHGKGIVHRDIKPENLFLTREHVLKVLDFGVARLLERSVSMTQSGGVLGTPAFMAPEQVLAKAREVDAQSDVWSVGATAFTLLSGRFVHEAETPEEMMVFTATRAAPSLATVAPQLPSALVRVVDRALKIDKRERWPTAKAMQAALDALGDAVSVGGAEPQATGADEPKERTPLKPPASGAAESPDDISTTTTAKRDASAPRLQEIRAAAADAAPSSSPPSAHQGTKIAPPQSTISGVTANTARAPAILLAMRRRKLRTIAALGGIATVAAGILVAVVGKHGPPQVDPVRAATSSPPETSPVSSGPPAPAPESLTPVPPSVAVEALPSKPRPVPAPVQAPPRWAPAPPPAAPVASAAATQAAPSPPSPSSPKSKCVPPFTVDPSTGMKKWKVECL